MNKNDSNVLNFRGQMGCFIIAILSFLIAFGAKDVKAESYEYDSLNRVTKVIHDDQSYTIYEYDAGGNIVKETFHEKDRLLGEREAEAAEALETPKESFQEDQKEEETPPEEPQEKSDENKHEIGMKAESKHAVYKILSVKNRRVSFEKLKNQKKTTYTVPNTVKIDGVVYNVTQIGKNAFKNNKKIKKVTIGKNVASIGTEAFSGCKKLKTLVIKTPKLKSVGKKAFLGIHAKATIKVPKKQYEAYKKLLKGKGQKKTVKLKKV